MSEHPTVPVDQRWLGMDKRGLPYALVALGLIALLTRIVPAINDAVAWDDPVEAGDVLDLGAGITLTPPVGWQVEDGVLTSSSGPVPVSSSSATALVVDGTTSISVTNGSWDGTPDELLDQKERIEANDPLDDRPFEVAGSRSTFSTASGIVGVSEPFTSAAGSGTNYAFVVEDADGGSIGTVITVVDASETPTSSTDEALAAVASLTVEEDR